MTSLVQYSLSDGVATITLDDGKRNALSAEMVRPKAGIRETHKFPHLPGLAWLAGMLNLERGGALSCPCIRG